MALPQYHRSGRLWYVSDGFIWDDLPASYRPEPGRPLECSSKLLVFNPQRRTARVTVRFYHVDRSPTAREFNVGSGKIESIELATLPEVPHRQAFWIVLESDVPVLPQARHEDYTFWDPVPDAMVAVAPYPGPLEDETAWVFPDCYQGDSPSWYEREMLTLLNPHQETVIARIRYLHRGCELGAEETVEVPSERVVALEPWERSPRLLGVKNGPPVRVVGDYAVRIDTTAPVVAQSTRRARWMGRPSIVGARSTLGFPLRECGHDVWYYPGGMIVDRGILPRSGENQHPLSQCDNTWNLLFINNVNEKGETHATITFHQPNGVSIPSQPLVIPPLKSTLQCLHAKPWLGTHTRVDEPFALTVTADRPMAAEVCCAEFEMWSQVCPGAMTAVNLYPGPLVDEDTWWLGIGQAGGADDVNTEWQQTYHFFNPGPQTAHVELSFVGLDNASQGLCYRVDVGAGAVVRVESSAIEGLPLHQPFAVRATGDTPFCAQVFGRTFTRGLPPTRAMYSMMGVPMILEEGMG